MSQPFSPAAPAPPPPDGRRVVRRATASRWRRLVWHAWAAWQNQRQAALPAALASALQGGRSGRTPHLNAEALERLAAQVRASESRHSGEIRLCIESHLSPSAVWSGLSPRARALAVFAELGVWDTAGNNGVLIYLLQADRAIEIVADRGLSARAAPEVWQQIVQTLARHLARGEQEAGLAQAIAAVNTLLVTHFAREPGSDDRNELPDEPVMR